MAATTKQHLPLALILFLFFSPSLAAADTSTGSSCNSDSFSKNQVYTTCTPLQHLGANLHFTYDSPTSTLSFAFTAAPPSSSGWVAWALNPTSAGMSGSQALVAFKSSSGSYTVKTYNISGLSIDPTMTELSYNFTDLSAEADGGSGRVSLFGKVTLPAGGVVNQVWQTGPSVTGGVPDPHATNSDNLAAAGKLNLVTGVSSGGAGINSVAKERNIHGILNAVSWGILLPIGAIVARYLKTFKGADPAWFYLHVSCQLIGYCVGVAGWATGINLGSKAKGVQYTGHKNIGITLFALGTLQLFALFLRPKKDHKYRFYWNMYHHTIGYTVIVLGVVNIFKGLDILGVEKKWRTSYIVVISVLAAIALILEAVTWSIVMRRRKTEEKPYGGGSSNGLRPLSA